MPLLATKLRPPAPRRGLVARARLAEQMGADATMPRLVLISAPAGFGKTTLLTQWLTVGRVPDVAEQPGPPPRRVGWLSLDPADDDLRAFLTHLVAALQTMSPEMGAEALALMDTDSCLSAEDVVASLVNDLDALPGRTVVALDDYHVLAAPEIHEAVEFLVAHLPPQVTLAMTTRADPPLPLSRLRARGELLEVRAADLRFTANEADVFLNQVMGLGLQPDHVQALEARTEGWVAGLQLAALSARGHTRSTAAPASTTNGGGGSAPDQVTAFVEAFTGSNRFVLDYLVEEVLLTQPDAVRAFLLDTSVLEQLTGPLCDALTGGSDGTDGQRMLEFLERANVFLVPLDDERRWFRYHHLFADALRARLQGESPARVPRLHRAASDWHAEHGTLSDAISHAVAGGDLAHAADLLELALPQLRKDRQDGAIRDWLQALPEDVIRVRALLATQRGLMQLSDGDLYGAEAWLDDADTALKQSVAATTRPSSWPIDATRALDADLDGLPAQTAVFRAALAQARGDVAGTVQHARRAVDLAGPDDHVARSGGAGFLGLATWAAGDLAEAVEVFAETPRSLHAAGFIADELGSTVVLASMWLGLGEPLEAHRLYERALATADAHPGPVLSTTGDLHVGLADVLREQGDLDEAAKHLEVARGLGQRASLPENRHRWFTATAALLVARGDLDGAAGMLDEAEPLFLPGFYPDVRPIPAMRARIRIAQGRLDDAAAWARERQVNTEDAISYLAEYDQLTLVRLVTAQHRSHPEAPPLGGAVALLDRIVAAAEAAERGGSLVEALLVRALAHDANGDPAAAVADLGRSVRTGVPAGYRRLFLDEGPATERLLRALAGRKELPGSDQAATLLETTTAPSAIPSRAVGTTPQDGVLEALSEREVDVLRLLATDLTGPDIAGQLFMSVNTFRTHTKHIFTKLEVTTRRAAVTRASDLDLL